MHYSSLISVLGAFSPVERIIGGSIGALFALVILLLGYALILRISFNRREGAAERRVREWEPLVLEYLEGGAADPKRFALKPREWVVFGEFIGEYLENLQGAEHERLLDLLRALRFERLLMKPARSGNRWRRAYAIQYLGRMRYRPAAGLLLSLLGNRSPVVAFSALEALQMLEVSLDFDRIIREALHRDDLGYPKISEVISRFGTPVHPSLIRLLPDPELSVAAKRLIVDILADNRVAEGVPPILGLLGETREEELVIGCIKALGILEAPESLPALAGYLASSNWIVRSQAVRAIGAVGTEREIPVLTDLLRHDGNFRVKQYCVYSLIRLGGPGIAALETMRGDPSLPESVETMIGHAFEEKGR